MRHNVKRKRRGHRSIAHAQRAMRRKRFRKLRSQSRREMEIINEAGDNLRSDTHEWIRDNIKERKDDDDNSGA